MAANNSVEPTVDVAAAAAVSMELSFDVATVEAVTSCIASDTFVESNATVNDAGSAVTAGGPMQRVRRHWAKWARRSR